MGQNLLLFGWGGTTFADTNLANVAGLESCDHWKPSSVDHITLINSGNLPEVFLRGCGFPDSFIDNLPSLIGAVQPIQFYSCFISYASKDDEFARRLYADLQAKGVRCWFAPENLKIGDRFRKSIHDAIRIHDKLLLVLSENSVKSDWVEKEVESAFEQEKKRTEKSGKDEMVLFPICLDYTVTEIDCGWPGDIRRTRHIGDFTKWKDYDQYTKSFDRLLKDLKASIGDKK